MLPFSSVGSGPVTIVFLHFFGGSSCEWTKVVNLLAPSFRCVAADAPGFGDGSGIEGYTVEEMTQSVLVLLDSLSSEPVILAGHSMMGKVAMVAASRRPANLIGLILIAPSPLVPEPITEPDRITMAEAQATPGTAREFFLKGANLPLDPADIRQGIADVQRADPTAWRRWPQSGTREDWSQAIPTIDLTTLVVVGEKDKAIPLKFQRLHTMPHLPKGRLEVIPEAGHLTPYEAPAELAALISSFATELKP
jgi:pimeloyl-ACP methyl ester carboxylesterase